MDTSSTTFNIRETSLNIQDVGAFVDLFEIIRAEDEPNIPAEKRLEWRKRAVEHDGKTCIGYTIESDDQTVGMVNYSNIGNLPNEGTPISSLVIVCTNSTNRAHLTCKCCHFCCQLGITNYIH